MAATVRFIVLLKQAFERAFEDDFFGIAKSAAYSSVLTLFPALLVLASVLATSHTTQSFLEQIAYAVGLILPEGAGTVAVRYFESPQRRPVGWLIATSLLTLWTSSGVMVSWMEGFRHAYRLPRLWGIVKERFIAFGLVLASFVPMTFATLLVAFGDQIETWLIFHSAHEMGQYILLAWTASRWLIAMLTSVAVLAVIYHFAVPRTQPWHTVIPGATLATALWFLATTIFGWYLRHAATYSLIYGSLAGGIALMVWMWLVSLTVLYGAEFNALLFPRVLRHRRARESQPEPEPEAEKAAR